MWQDTSWLRPHANLNQIDSLTAYCFQIGLLSPQWRLIEPQAITEAN